MKLSKLADTLELIATNGSHANFYTGALAEIIEEEIQSAMKGKRFDLKQIFDISYARQFLNINHINTYHAADLSKRQFKNVTKLSKLSKLWNLVTIFGITMRNAFK